MMAPASGIDRQSPLGTDSLGAQNSGLKAQGQAKFFEIKILISKSPVSKILRGTSQTQIQQLPCNQDFAEFDPKNRGGGGYTPASAPQRLKPANSRTVKSHGKPGMAHVFPHSSLPTLPTVGTPSLRLRSGPGSCVVGKVGSANLYPFCGLARKLRACHPERRLLP